MTRHTNKDSTSRSQHGKPLSQGRAAQLLGVTREHLNRVLNGKRSSRRLLTQYKQLV